MSKYSSHQQKVHQFFEQLASKYPQRYSQQQPYLHYWFAERLHQALGKKNYTGKHLLDIGAGHGALYDVLLRKTANFVYTATDVSAAMLAQSNIPSTQRWVGSIKDWPNPRAHFDHIFMLGLVSYLEPADLQQHLYWAHTHLHPQGSLCISFTNRASWDFRLRLLLRPLLRWLPGQGVVQQAFGVRAHTVEEAEALCTVAGFRIVQLVYIAPGVPFLQHLSPGLAAKTGRWLNKKVQSQAWRRRLCPDFLLHLELLDSARVNKINNKAAF